MYDRPMRAGITATGWHVPSDVYTNEYFASRLETTDEWIRSRTGMVERRFAKDGGTSDLALEAARRCLEMRQIPASAVDGIIVATMTPDRPLPSTAAIL
jgi:3-oxoacyl-[acyl-carrier-protein] synthase-3